MIESETFQTRVAALEKLMQDKLGGRGRTLEKRFARAGRLLPKRIRQAGRRITEAQAALHHPKLARLQDPRVLNAAFAEITAHLKTIDPADRRKGLLLGILGGLTFNLILLAVAIVVLLRWQNII